MEKKKQTRKNGQKKKTNHIFFAMPNKEIKYLLYLILKSKMEAAIVAIGSRADSELTVWPAQTNISILLLLYTYYNIQFIKYRLSSWKKTQSLCIYDRKSKYSVFNENGANWRVKGPGQM